MVGVDVVSIKRLRVQVNWLVDWSEGRQPPGAESALYVHQINWLHSQNCAPL